MFPHLGLALSQICVTEWTDGRLPAVRAGLTQCCGESTALGWQTWVPGCTLLLTNHVVLQ